MALWHLLLAAKRHFIIVLVGMMFTLGGAMAIHSHAGLFQMQTRVVISPPPQYETKNLYLGRDYSLIATASLVQKIVNQHSGGAMTASSSVTLAGKGLKDGYSVSLPNNGNQWSFDYNRPVLEVQSVGRSQERATANLDAAVAATKSALTEMQDKANVPAERRMTVESGAQPQLFYSKGRPSRSLLGMAVLGMGLTLAAVLFAEERNLRFRSIVARLRSGRSAHGSAPSPPEPDWAAPGRPEYAGQGSR